MLFWLLLSGLAAGGVLWVSWWLNRRAWRAEQARSRDWLLTNGIDPGSAPVDPAPWRLVLTPDLSAGGRFVHEVAAGPTRTWQPET